MGTAVYSSRAINTIPDLLSSRVGERDTVRKCNWGAKGVGNDGQTFFLTPSNSKGSYCILLLHVALQKAGAALK